MINAIALIYGPRHAGMTQVITRISIKLGSAKPNKTAPAALPTLNSGA
jgi:hypothetical protein